MDLNNSEKHDKKIPFHKISMIVAIAMSLFHLYTSVFGILEAWRHRSVHVIFVLILACFVDKNLPRKFAKAYRVIILLLTFGVSLYMWFDYSNIIMREGIPSMYDKVFATILIFLVLDSARRFVGKSMTIIGVIFIIYTMYGSIIPGRLASPSFSYGRIIAQLFNTTSGIMGPTTGVAATSVIAFILFGAFLQVSGGSDFFSDFALYATRGVTGGPAKASIISSALVGSIQGNAISNVVTTGTFTIPLMIKSGYSKIYAASVESAASTGGMIMPPVMGAAAFVLAEFTKTSYSTILKYAILPAILYYVGIFLMVHFNALKNNIKCCDEKLKLGKEEMVWQGTTCLLPMFLLVFLLLRGFSPMRSAVFAIGVLVLIWIVRPIKRLTIPDLLSALEKGGKGMLSVSSACIAAGIIVGTVSLTGLATKIAILVSIAGANVWIVLILSMIVSIIFGMGLPVTASYVIAAITLGGIFNRVGINLIQGHMFLLYFATMSAITPPVALASYTAAGIANVDPNRVGYRAFILALPGFIIPYIFVFNQELFLIGEPLVIARVITTSLMSIFAVAVSLEGWLFTHVRVLTRIGFLVTAIALIMVSPITDLVGVIVIVPLCIINYLHYKKTQII